MDNMELIVHIPTRYGFTKLGYMSFEAFRREMLDILTNDKRDIDNYLGYLFLECRWILIEDIDGELHLTDHPTDVYNLKAWKTVREEAEKLKREKAERLKKAKEQENDELPF